MSATIAHSQRIPVFPGSLVIGDPEDRVVRGDREQLVVGGVRADSLEEHPDFELPLLEVGAQHARPVLDRHLRGGEPLDPAADPQLAAARLLRTHWVFPRGATRYRSPSKFSGFTGVVRHSPDLRPRTARIREP